MSKFYVFFLIACISTPSIAGEIYTAQIPDKIHYDGKTYNLNSNPLETYFQEYPDKRPKGGVMSTALWRGYIGEYKIIENTLVVEDIKILVYRKNSEGESKSEWISAYDQVFPASRNKVVDWFTGILVLPHGKLVNYVHMGYSSTYKKYWLLELKEGKLGEVRFYKHKEYLDFKLRQFREYQKTEEYAKVVKEIKENDPTTSDEFIETFLFDYLSDYAKEFLTD